jgi:hypothetical protein
MSNIFEKASRLKVRFTLSTTKSSGTISVEDLWELSLPDLDNVAKKLNKEIKDSSEESFITSKSKADELLELKFELVKHVITVKLLEKEKKALDAQRKSELARIDELIAKKEINSLEEKSLDELMKMRNEYV